MVRLKEWQDILKRVEGDKAQQAAAAAAAVQAELEAELQQAGHKQLEMEGEVQEGRVAEAGTGGQIVDDLVAGDKK